MNVELFTTAYNEELLLPRMVDFYRERIPGIIINVYDNYSTDRTKEIAMEKGCRLHNWGTNGELCDGLLLHFKNNIWKQSTADYIIVCDVDEWVDFTPHAYAPDILQANVYFKSIGYNMVSDTMGARFSNEDKVCVFSPAIGNINYEPGAHTAHPDGHESPLHPKLYHMKYSLPVDLVVKRYKDNAKRLSGFNKEHGFAVHYAYDEGTIRKEFAGFMAQAEKVR